MHPILAKIGSAAKWVVHVEEFHHRRSYIIALWAGVEAGLDIANTIAWAESKKTISKVIPQSLRWKLQLFEEIHKKLAAFEPLRKQADAILADIKALQDDRHWIVHAVFLPVGRVADGWHLRKTKFKRDGSVEFEKRVLTRKEMGEIHKRVQKLAFKLSRYIAALALKFGKDVPNDHLS